MTRTLYLFDDRVARGWEPFALTRPVGELLFGSLLMRRRIERSIGQEVAGYLATPGLDGFEERGAPPVLAADAFPREGERILLSSRYLPPVPLGTDSSPEVELPEEIPEGEVELWTEGERVGWLLAEGRSAPSVAELLDPTEAGSDGAARLTLPGRVLESPWQLMSESPRWIASDLARLYPGGRGGGATPLPSLVGVHRVGRHPVSAADGVRVDPGVVLDSREGPIHLGARVHIMPLTHLHGPAFIGPDTTLLGGTMGSLTCGPRCKLRGEIEASVILGFSNKAHDGYLGHSLLGRWVNLGAGTTNSDLKNNYGPVRLDTSAGTVDTGLMKVGVFLGDHVKTGIGTLLNSGTLVGAGSNLFGGGMPGKAVPPFSWGVGDDLVPHRLEPFLQTAERAMGRREIPLTPGLRDFLARGWSSVHGSEAEREEP